MARFCLNRLDPIMYLSCLLFKHMTKHVLTKVKPNKNKANQEGIIPPLLFLTMGQIINKPYFTFYYESQQPFPTCQEFFVRCEYLLKKNLFVNYVDNILKINLKLNILKYDKCHSHISP